tara:strand:+ start:75 stop:470 length:396 start_codon:yes stop_codon:yes gene_type:complete
MAAITSNGTTVTWNGAIADVVSITAPSVTVATIDTTNIASVHRTFLGGTIDSGEVSLEIMYDPNSDTDIEDAWDVTATAAPVASDMVITFSDSSTYTFSAIMTGFSVTVATDAAVTASATFKISGAVTVAT